MVHVFDISQTDGDELPEIPCHRLDGVGAAYDELTLYAEGLGFLVEVGELPGETNGLCNHATQTITVRTGLALATQTKTLAHDVAHAMLHGSAFDGPRAQAELEAESVAYIACGLLGIDSAQYSWGLPGVLGRRCRCDPKVGPQHPANRAGHPGRTWRR